MTNFLLNTEEYLSFRSAIPLKKIIVDSNDSKEWKFYDAGPKTILGLSALGYRVIAVDYPVYWTVDQFCIGLRKLIDHLNLERVHLFGCSIGGFLALKFSERMRNAHYVASIILCNAFTDTSVFKYTTASNIFWMVPSFILKRLVLKSYPSGMVDKEQADAIDFHVECLESLNQQDIASRLTIHCSGEYVRHPESLQHLPVTIVEVFDNSVLSQKVKDDICKCFPLAKRACIKTGGNFPYLSRSPEVNLYLRIHLKQFEGKPNSAVKGMAVNPQELEDQHSSSPLMRSISEAEDKSHLRDCEYSANKTDINKQTEELLAASSIEDDGEEPEDFPI